MLNSSLALISVSFSWAEANRIAKKKSSALTFSQSHNHLSIGKRKEWALSRSPDCYKGNKSTASSKLEFINPPYMYIWSFQFHIKSQPN